MSLECDWVI